MLGHDTRLALDDGLQPPHGVDRVGRLAREEQQLADALADAPGELRERGEAGGLELPAAA